MKWILTAIALCLSVHAQSITDERSWTGRNGKSIRGIYIKTLENGSKVQIAQSSGKILTIDIANLCEKDQQFLSKATARRAPKTESPTREAFKSDSELDRDRIPIISQGDFGQKASDCVPSSFCNFLLWWDAEGFLEIPNRGDFDDKAEWIHTRMARHCRTRNNSGTYLSHAREGFADYFQQRLRDTATMRFKTDYDLRPENLLRYTTGANATMLSITIRRGPRHDSGHWVALISAKEDGEVVFHTWGQRFVGQLKIHEENPEPIDLRGQIVPKTSYVIQIQNQQDLPSRHRDDNVQFLMIPEKWDGIHTLRPYVFAEGVKPTPPPVEPLMTPVHRD